MESEKESTGVCQKLFKAVTGSSGHRKSGGPKVTDSLNLQNADKSGKTHVSVPLKIQSYHHSKKKEESTSVFLEIEGGHQELKKPSFSSLKGGKVVKVRPNIVIEGHDHQPAIISKKSENHEIFTEYISQVKDKIRSKSSFSDHDENAKAAAVAVARSATRKDSFNDKIANYINRARNNIKTTSNVGDTTT